MTLIIYLTLLCLISFVLYDVFKTVLSTKGSGPITGFWSKHLWRLSLWVHYKKHNQWLIKKVGPVMLVLIFFIWYGLLNICWFFLFSQNEFSIKNSNDPDIGLLDIFYYVGSTFSTLGLGDYTPNGFPWTLATTFGAFIISVITSAAISYIVPVLSAVVSRRVVITQLDSLRAATQDFEIIFNGEDKSLFQQKIMDAVGNCVEESYKARVYPVLLYFHYDENISSMNGSLISILDTIALQAAQNDAHAPTSIYIINSMQRYCDNLRDIRRTWNKSLQIDQEEFTSQFSQNQTDNFALGQFSLKDLAQLRKNLVLLCHLEGYCPMTEPNKLSFKNSLESKVQHL